MAAQIIRMVRRAVCRQIIRRCADRSRDRHDPPRDQARVLEVGNAQRDVETALHRIDLIVAQHELDLQRRILRHEICDRRPELQRAERHRRIDAQQALRRRLQMRDRLIGRIDIRQDAQRAFEIGLSVFIRAGMARGAVQQLDAEALFEFADIFADRRARQPQLPPGFREAAELNDLHEGAQAGEFVHDGVVLIVIQS